FAIPAIRRRPSCSLLFVDDFPMDQQSVLWALLWTVSFSDHASVDRSWPPRHRHGRSPYVRQKERIRSNFISVSDSCSPAYSHFSITLAQRAASRHSFGVRIESTRPLEGLSLEWRL